MVTVKSRATLRFNKINPSDRIFYTTDGTEPTTSSAEWTSGDVEVYGHTRVKTLTVSSTGESKQSFPLVYVILMPPEEITLTENGFQFSLPDWYSNYQNLTAEIYDSSNNLKQTIQVTNPSSVSVEVDEQGYYFIRLRADNTWHGGRARTPTISFVCQEPTISYEADYENGTATVTITQNGFGSTYYTTDGSDPSCSNGTLYSGPFQLEETAEVKAITVKTGWTSSQVVSEMVYVSKDTYFAIGNENFLIGSGSVVIGFVVEEEE